MILGSTLKKKRKGERESQIKEEEEEEEEKKHKLEVKELAGATLKSGFVFKSNLFVYDENQELAQVSLSKTVPRNKGFIDKSELEELRKRNLRKAPSF